MLLFHTGWGVAGGGFIGVDLFFVLSGFLVSNVILSEVDRTGRFRLGHFYARRVRRLLPAAVVVIVATSAVFVLVSSLTRRLSLVGDAQSALLYVANWRFLLQSEDYFAENVNESPFLHFWSLAIEEQFYFVFPVLLLVLLRARKRRTAVLLGGVGLAFLLSLGAQLYWARVDPNHAYYGTDARLYQLLAGVLLAVAFRTWHVHVRRRHAEVVAVGECGLDYFRNFSPRDAQLEAFAKQLELAADVGKPVFLHQRDAHTDFMQVMHRYRARLAGGVAHCFTAGMDEARAYLDLDLYIGITGWICDERRGHHLREVVKHIPAERLLIETDAPYLLPRDLQPKPQHRRNEPMYLPHVLAAIAQARGEAVEQLAEVTTENALRLFRWEAVRG